MEQDGVTRWKSLGAATHYRAHLTLQLREDPNFPLPDGPSTSAIAIGHSRSQSHPPDALVYAIDRRAGRTDYDIANRQEYAAFVAALSRALPLLQDWDEVAFRTVHLVCIRGRVQLLPGSRLRHTGPGYEVAATQYFGGDFRRLQRWTDRAWDFLALVLAPGEARAAAIERGAVSTEALCYLQERGLV